jgi:FkbM family methyltransferase
MTRVHPKNGFLGAGWRLPLYRRYWYYFKTCTNFIQIIQSERKNKLFTEFKIRGGIRLQFPDYIQARGFFQEIWYHEQYTKHYPRHQHPNVVVDIGANIGFFTLYAKWRWQGCAVLAFEPAPENYRQLNKNIQISKKSGITAHNLAVSKGDQETVTFYLKDQIGWHSIYSDINSQKAKVESAVEIPTTSFERILNQLPGSIDFLKIDCEGCEWEIFANSLELLKRVGYIAMEYHLPPGKTVDELAAVLRDADFVLQIDPPFDWGDWKLGFLYARKPG